MRKFIHSNFEIDLSKFKITDTAENPWVTDNYFTKYSYPFELPFDDENDMAFGLLSEYNSTNGQTVFEGWYVHGNTMEKAVLEIEELERSFSVTLRYGYDDFPNFTKKLSDLPLEKKNVADIYVHAAAIITQGWPAVNYNFPQIHVDKYNTDDDMWHVFEKVINNYKAGAFIINDVIDDIAMNRNIIQPLPYVLHVLKKGVEDAGYTLRGDVLEDPEMQKVLLYADCEYFSTLTQESVPVYKPAFEFLEKWLEVQYHDYNTPAWYRESISIEKSVSIDQAGRYRIVGEINICRLSHYRYGKILIKYRNTILYQDTQVTSTNIYPMQFIAVPINLVFDTINDLSPHEVSFYVESLYDSESITFDLMINPIRFHDDEGNPLPTVLNNDKVDLTRAVADKTFGDVVKLFLATKRFNFETLGGEVWMNYISKEVAVRPIIDLTAHEVRYPKRKFNTGNSVVLKYQEVQSEDYKYAQVFQSRDGVKQEGFIPNDKTKEIAIDAIPLPLTTREGVQTAHGFLADKSKLMLVVYDGLMGGLNVSRDPSHWTIPVLHSLYHYQWIATRIDGSSYGWTFYTTYEELIALTHKSRVFAFRNLHLVKTIQKNEFAPDLFEVEIETEVLK